MVKNVYIHIPFCKTKCKYCSFISYPCISLKNEFLNALEIEIEHRYKGEILNTVYFGGGTPSTLTTEEFEGIIKCFKTTGQTEITAELNPETLTYEYLKNLRQVGINRISLGCQTFDDNILKLIGRRHNSEKVINAVKYAKDAEFNNISLDFIYGLPTQTLSGFEEDLKKAARLEIQHISLYGLKIDEGCYFYKNMPDNLPDDDTQADMYLKAIETLTKEGFEHYEISNFSQKGFNSKHNLNYWDNNTYYGFGSAAHGYVDGIRYSNAETLEEYINNPTTHALEHIVKKDEQLEEEIFLGFRRKNGINTKIINKKFNIDFEKEYADVLQKYQSTSHLIKTEDGYRFSDEGFMISNIILSDFLH